MWFTTRIFLTEILNIHINSRENLEWDQNFCSVNSIGSWAPQKLRWLPFQYVHYFWWTLFVFPLLHERQKKNDIKYGKKLSNKRKTITLRKSEFSERFIRKICPPIMWQYYRKRGKTKLQSAVFALWLGPYPLFLTCWFKSLNVIWFPSPHGYFPSLSLFNHIFLIGRSFTARSFKNQWQRYD